MFLCLCDLTANNEKSTLMTKLDLYDLSEGVTPLSIFTGPANTLLMNAVHITSGLVF